MDEARGDERPGRSRYAPAALGRGSSPRSPPPARLRDTSKDPSIHPVLFVPPPIFFVTSRITSYSLKKTCENRQIADDTKNLGPGYEIGHSYFCPGDGIGPDDAWFQRVVDSEIVPLLQEYWLDDDRKVQQQREAFGIVPRASVSSLCWLSWLSSVLYKSLSKHMNSSLVAEAVPTSERNPVGRR